MTGLVHTGSKRWWAIVALGVGCVLPLSTSCRPRPQATAGDTAAAAVDASARSLPEHDREPFLRVLGTVQDGGLPHPGCRCERCDLARRQTDSRRWITSLALVLPDSSEIFLFDVTPDIRQQLDMLADLRSAPAGAVDREPLDGLFLTHAHIGHYLGLAFFGYEALHTTNLPLWATPRMAEYLRHNGPWSQLVDFGNVELRELQSERRIGLGSGVSVLAFAAPHRDEYADTLGFTITGPNRRLVYLPDTDSWRAWEQPLPQFLSGVDIALLDGTFYSVDELPGRSIESIGHPLIPDTMDLLQELVDTGSLQVYFTHLNHSNPALTLDSEARRAIESRGFRVLAERQEFSL